MRRAEFMPMVGMIDPLVWKIEHEIIYMRKDSFEETFLRRLLEFTTENKFYTARLHWERFLLAEMPGADLEERGLIVVTHSIDKNHHIVTVELTPAGQVYARLLGDA